jgi:predicted MFS family arabinose efflux permease
MLIGSLEIGVLTMIFALSANPWFALTITFLMGPPYQLRNIAQRTFLQSHTTAEWLPKALAAFGTLTFVSYGCSVLLMGWIADHYTVQFVYIFTAGLNIISAVLASMAKKNTFPFDTNSK